MEDTNWLAKAQGYAEGLTDNPSPLFTPLSSQTQPSPQLCLATMEKVSFVLYGMGKGEAPGRLLPFLPATPGVR